jgi:tetratricopeptide (TPR) repeat protein
VVKVGSGRGAIGRMLGRPRLWIWLSVSVLVLGIGLTWLPLFNVLGFELAISTSVFAAICGLDLGAAHARELQWMDEPALVRAVYPGRALARSTVMAALLAVAVVLPPALIAAVRGLWLPTCDWWFGIKAYLAMPIVTAALAGALGHALGVAAGSRAAAEVQRDLPFAWGYAGALGVLLGVVVAIAAEDVVGGLIVGGALAIALGGLFWLAKPHRSTLVAMTPLVLVAGGALYGFYAAPPVFTYNAILGYFPGNLYDENVELGMPLLWSRVEQAAWVFAVVSIVAARLDVPRFRVALEPRPASRRLGPIALALVATATGLGLHTFGGELGYRIQSEEIQAHLGGRIETPHFVIHYANTPEIERDIALVAADHEFRYAQVVALVGAAPPGKLRSYVFASREQKARLIGAKDVEMAKPWRREIYLEHRAFPHGSLRHEIAHAVASAFGDPIFGVAAQRIAGVPVMVSPGLIEGLAVALDWPAGYERLTPHEAVRAMQAMGLTPTIRELVSLRFLTVSSARSYTTAGSFMKYLLDTYGAPMLRKLYGNGGDFETVYGKSLSRLEAEWRTMISAIVLPVEEIEGTRERFRAGSVFARPCPHANAARRERARISYARGDRPAAIALLRAVCNDAPDEPRYKLELGDFLVSGGGSERVEAIALWTALAESKTVTSSLRADAYERLARLAAATGDLARTKELIKRARELPVDPNARRQLEAEWIALEHPGKAGAALRGYFFAPPGTWDGPNWALLATLAEPELGFGFYLYGLQKANLGEWQEAAEALDRSLALGVPSIAFTKNAARRLAVAAFRAGDTARVERAIAVLRQQDMNEIDRLLAGDWEQRIAFAATGRLSK